MPIVRGQITIVDLNDAKSMNMYLGSNQPLTQIFNKENSTYVPNYTASPGFRTFFNKGFSPS